jgi:hypothetical protein
MNQFAQPIRLLRRCWLHAVSTPSSIRRISRGESPGRSPCRADGHRRPLRGEPGSDRVNHMRLGAGREHRGSANGSFQSWRAASRITTLRRCSAELGVVCRWRRQGCRAGIAQYGSADRSPWVRERTRLGELARRWDKQGRRKSAWRTQLEPRLRSEKGHHRRSWTAKTLGKSPRPRAKNREIRA